MITARSRSIRFVLAAAFSLVAPAASAADECKAQEPCAARACRLDAEIAKAKAKGNSRALAGLERERAEMVHCSDEGLKQKRKMALEQARRRIEERETALKRAEATGDAAKIRKAQRSVESARKAYVAIEDSRL